MRHERNVSLAFARRVTIGAQLRATAIPAPAPTIQGVVVRAADDVTSRERTSREDSMGMRWMGMAVLLVATGGCNQPAPSAPGETIPSANQAPRIHADPINPALGIDEVTTFTLRVEVADPEGDPVSLTMSGCPVSINARGDVVDFGQPHPVTLRDGAATISFTATSQCPSAITLRATDSRGATTETAVSFAHTRVGGYYRLVLGDDFDGHPYFIVDLHQTGAAITGTIHQPAHVGGRNGRIDPNRPGSIDAAGRFRVAFDIASFGALSIRGQVVSADDLQQLANDVLVGSGSVIDGPYAGRSFTLWREAAF